MMAAHLATAALLIPVVLAALLVLQCTLLIAAAWWGTRHQAGLLAARCKYTALVPLATAATWLTMFTAPAIALFAMPNGWLPWWLKWASTHDEWLFGLATQIRVEPMPRTWTQRWWAATRWLWRNPAYHFAHHVCGYRQANHIAGSNRDIQSAVLTVAGVKVQTLTPADRLVGIYAAAPWGNAFFVNVDFNLGFKTIRVGAGWKLWRNTPQGSTDPRAGDPDGVSMMATKIGLIS